MFGLFKKTCSICGGKFFGDTLNFYDSRGVGRKEKYYLCRDCFEKKVTGDFCSYKHFALAVYPVEGVSVYGFWKLDQFKDNNIDILSAFSVNYNKSDTIDANVELRNDIISIMPKAKSHCEKCGEESHFIWCSPEIYTYEKLSIQIDPDNNFKKEVLCGKCFSEEFFKKTREQNKVFEIFTPLTDCLGYLTSYWI